MNSASEDPATGEPPRRADRALLLVMAVATGLTVGGNYLNQPLLDTIAADFGTSQGIAASTVTVAQVSYGLGLLLIVPLGDVLEKRRLLTVLTLLAAAGHAISALSPSLPWLLAGTAVAGAFSVAAQVLVPFVAELVPPGEVGRAVGTVMSGLLVGALLARSLSGVLADLGGWHLPYAVVSAGLIVLAGVLHRRLPVSRPREARSYGAALRSVGHLVRTQPRLRSRALLGGCGFATVAVLFSSMTFLLAGAPLRLSDAQIGFAGFAAVGGALAATVAGRLNDAGRGQLVTGVGAGLLVASWLVLGASTRSLPLFLLGSFLVDLALQAVHITNQNVVYAIAPQARSRLNSAYMTTYFVGGAVGSAVGSAAWTRGGWSAVTVAGLVFAAVTVLVWLLDLRVSRRARG